MNHSKRHGEILRLLRDEGTITIADLAARLGVSLETVRRDVRPLTSGGAVTPARRRASSPVSC